MRDIAVTLVVIIGCLYTIKRPYIGVLLWSWLSYMNPHRLCYGFAYSMPFAQVTAVILIASTMFSKDKQRIPFGRITAIWVVFTVFMGVTTYFAYFPDKAWVQYSKVLKIFFITFLTIVIINDIEKLRKLIWVIVLSIGYYSVKGGFFTIKTGGGEKVWGPAGSFIEDNNGLAVAVLMIIPLMIYLYQTEKKEWVKKSLIMAVMLSLFSVLGSQSRGAFLAIVIVGFNYWIKSDKKVVTAITVLVIATALFTFMPESWYKRMGTINEYEEDKSAMGRLNAWEYAFNAANHNILGMGFDSWSSQTFAMYAPNPLDVHAAHSIYFTILADHGWIGFFLYLIIYLMTWNMLKKVIKDTSQDIKYKEYNILSRMIQIGFLAYFSGGAFLSLSYFDLPWHFISFVILLRLFLDREKVDISYRNRKLRQDSIYS